MRIEIKVALIGAAALIIVAVIGLVGSKDSKKLPPISQTTSGDQSPAIVAQRDVNISGIPPELFEKKTEELGVTKAALKSFFKILKITPVPIEDLDSRLRNFAEKYIELTEQPTEDPLATKAKGKLAAGDIEGAEKLYYESFEKNLKASAKRNEAIASSAYKLGSIKELQLEYKQALGFYNQAVQLNPENTTYLNGFGNILFTLGQFGLAEKIFSKALKITEVNHGKERDYFVTLSHLAGVIDAQGRKEEAEKLNWEVLKYIETNYKKVDYLYFATLTNQANIIKTQGRYEDAEKMYWKVIKNYETTIGKRDLVYAAILNNLANLLSDQSRYEEAENLYRQVIEIAEGNIGEKHVFYIVTMNNIAIAVKGQGRYEEAEKLYRQALEINKETFGEENNLTKLIKKNLKDMVKK